MSPREQLANDEAKLWAEGPEVIYMSAATARHFGFDVPPPTRFYSGRRRGGRYPRWRWRRVRFANCEAYIAGYAVVAREPDRWRATCHETRRFARRCDAKRWCEWMLANGGKDDRST